MSVFTSIRDMCDLSLILNTLREVGGHFYQIFHNDASSEEDQVTAEPQESSEPQVTSEPQATSESSTSESSEPQVSSEALVPSRISVSDEVYKNAVDVLKPLAYFLQNKASEELKKELGEMLAVDSEIVETLCEGILSPFVQEISIRGPREIRNANYLTMILLLHVCLMECSENLRVRQKLIQCGCIYLLLKELRNMTRVIQTDRDSNKFSQQLIQSAASVVGNCLSDNVDLYMRLHPDSDITGTFISYFKYPDSIVRLVCKLTYHKFAYYLHQSNPSSIDCSETISNYAQLLRASSESKHFVARVEKLFLEATDLLQVLQCLCTSTNNRQAMITNLEFHKAVTNLLIRGGEKEIECVLDLLLTCLTEEQPIARTKDKGKRREMQTSELPNEDSRESTRKELLSYFPEIVHQLESVLASPHGDSESLKTLCSAVLWYIQVKPDIDIYSCLRYVKCCYKYKHYGECCYWSDYIEQQCSSNAEAQKLRDHFLLFKAKAKFHIYQRQHVVLRRSEMLKNLGEIKQDRKKVYYDNAKEVISIFGFLKAKNFSEFDLECEQFLDYALMDYIRELNKRESKKSYCMLCHKKEAVVRSHIVPEATLKIIFGNDQEVFRVGPSSLSLESCVKTLHTHTFNMLCNVCDNEVLSYDENLFVKNVLKPIYSTAPISHLEKVNKIPYDRWLYRFCAGIIFRSLALSRGVTGSANAEEIHKLFHHCRLVVKPSAEPSATEHTAQTLQSQLLEVSKLETIEQLRIAMFFTPGLLEDQYSEHREKPSNLIHFLNSSVFQCLSNVSILGTLPSLAKKCCFFTVHFGIFNIVAFLEPVPLKYQHFLVDPHKGELTIPANNDRLSLIPPGLLKIYEERTEKRMKQYFEKIVEMNKSKNISLTVLGTNIVEKPVGDPTSFSLLPPKFELNRQTNIVTMKEGHSILLHHTYQSSSASHTVFLAVEKKAPTKPYVIIHSYLNAPTMSQTFGYFVSLPEFAFKDELDENHKEAMKQIRAKDLDLFKLPAKALPAAFKRAGLQGYQSILYHLNKNPEFDQKCIPGDGCWYCCRKCDICMLESTAGFLTQSDESTKPTLNFCGEECKSFSDCSRVFSPSLSVKKPLKEVTFLPMKVGSEEKPINGNIKCMHLLSITLSSHDERNQCPPIRAVMDIYRVSEGNDQLSSGQFIAIFELRTHKNKTFGEFFLNDELQLQKPLPHVTIPIDKEQIQLVNDVLHEGILKSGYDMDHICSLGLPVTTEPLLLKTDPEKENCGEVAGLEFSGEL